MEATLLFLGMQVMYVRVLLSVMAGPILFCVGKSVEPSVQLRPGSGIRQGVPLSPILLDVITVLLIYDIKSLKIQLTILLYTDDILFCVPGRGAAHQSDLRAALYRLNGFGYFSRLRVNPTKTFAVVKVREGDTMPATVAGVTVKEWVKYLGILLGNVSMEKAYAPVVAKMPTRARAVVSMSLSLEERAYLFVS